MHNRWVGAILAALVIIFSFWTTTVSKWIIVIIGVIWLVHSLTCTSCQGTKTKKAKPKKKK
jgi:general stress protein CsbA